MWLLNGQIGWQRPKCCEVEEGYLDCLTRVVSKSIAERVEGCSNQQLGKERHFEDGGRISQWEIKYQLICYVKHEITAPRRNHSKCEGGAVLQTQPKCPSFSGEGGAESGIGCDSVLWMNGSSPGLQLTRADLSKASDKFCERYSRHHTSTPSLTVCVTI